MIRVDAYLSDPAAQLAAGAFGAGALIRIERSPDNIAAYAEVTTLAIVAATQLYTYWDPTGIETSWFRWRISDAGNTVQSPYSDPFQGTSPTNAVLPNSYAQIQSLLKHFETKPSKPDKLARLSDLLVLATAQVIEQCGHRDYFRHPTSGTTTWVLDGNGSGVLHVHEGLISVSLLELSFDGGLTYVPVTASDYVLRGDGPFNAEPIPANEPYFHVRFTGWGQYTNFPPTVQSARLTGVRGWPAVPVALVEATAQRARQLGFAEGSYSGSNAGGPDEFGHAATMDRFWPQSLWNFLALERSRFMACHIGGMMSEPRSTGAWR